MPLDGVFLSFVLIRFLWYVFVFVIFPYGDGVFGLLLRGWSALSLLRVAFISTLGLFFLFSFWLLKVLCSFTFLSLLPPFFPFSFV